MPNTSNKMLKKLQDAVGKCPVCGKKPTWYNNIPLTAYCFGKKSKEHPQTTRIVPDPAQPYGSVGETKWEYGEFE